MLISRNQKQDKDPFGFSNLEALRLFCRQIQQDQSDSLKYFEYDVGYQHFRGKNKISISSSATCVLSLVATGQWGKSGAESKTLLQKLSAAKKSAGLNEENPFTLAWILETVTALQNRSDPLDSATIGRIAEIEETLQKATKGGGVSIDPYPPSAYLTQLVIRALRRRNKLTPELEEAVKNWAWSELTRQPALIQAKSKTQDAFAVAYLLLLVTAVTPSAKINPEQTSIQHAALKIFFRCQLRDGTWPLSRPLFHYPKFGNAYCYEYEMLTQLLSEPELQNLLRDYLPNLSAAAASVSNNVYRVENGVPAWTSGHHPNQAEPESWATASVYHFMHQLDRLLAEAVRREIFRYLESTFPRPSAAGTQKADFASKFLDGSIDVNGESRSLKEFLWDHFVRPLRDEAPCIAEGRSFNKGTPRSAIFFGPPGTSKTDLAKEIATFLGWSHLAVDPSHFLRNGMDGIQAEANTIFRMLEETERVVVLFDEFDELVRERGSSKAEPFSRLLTTAMLPKLARLHKRGTLVFIIATNNIGEFDLAIRREGRFDRVIQIMPPSYEAKLAKIDWGPTKVNIGGAFEKLGVKVTSEIKRQLGDLTYGECEAFAAELDKVTDKQEAIRALGDRWKKCTLQTHVGKVHVSKEEETTWAERCKTEAIHNR